MENPPPPTDPRIGLLPGNGGPRRSARNRASGEKLLPGTNSSTPDESTGNQTRNVSQPGPVNSAINLTQSKKRIKWTKEEYTNVILAYYRAQKYPTEGITKDTYTKWRQLVGDEVRKNIDANKLATQRRDILKNRD